MAHTTEPCEDPVRASLHSGYVAVWHSRHQNNFPCRWQIAVEPRGMIKCVDTMMGRVAREDREMRDMRDEQDKEREVPRLTS